MNLSTQDQSKALVRKIVLEYWTSKAGLEALAVLIAPGYVHHAPFGDLDFDGYRQAASTLIDAFPDAHFTLTHIIAEGDLVGAYVKNTATHLGQFGPVAPTGKVLTSTGSYFCRLADGKIVEDWDAWTILPSFRQMVAMLRL